MMVITSYYQVSKTDNTRIKMCHGNRSVWLNGSDVEHQYKVFSDKYLLLISGEELFEESLFLYLLTPDCIVLDCIEIGQEYADGALKGLEVTSSSSITFEYFNGLMYELSVCDQPSWRLNSPPGARYLSSIFKKKYLILK